MVCVTRVCSSDMDASGTNLFWAEPPSQALRASIESMGQLEPVLARFAHGRWHVLSGYRRVHALGKAGADILVIEVSGPPDPLADGLLYLHANSHRVLDDGMRLRALRYFRAWLEPEELARRIAPLLGLEPRSGAWRRLAAWLDLSPDWDALLCAGRLPLAAGPILAGLDQDGLAALAPFFQELKWSHSRALQWLTFLVETGKRENAGIRELLHRAGTAATLAEGFSPQDTLQRLLAQARTLRYPNLTDLEKKFHSLRMELVGSSRWELIPSEGFETDAVELRLRARNASDIRAASQALERLATSQRLPELFSIAR
jgi:hypothetical protein